MRDLIEHFIVCFIIISFFVGSIFLIVFLAFYEHYIASIFALIIWLSCIAFTVTRY